MKDSIHKLIFAIVLLVLLTAQLFVYSREQPQIAIGNGRGDDGITYGKVADAFLADERPVGDAPFVYRIGVPWLASIVSRSVHTPIDESFRLINIIALYILALLMYRLALRFCAPVFASFVCALYMLPFYGNARLVYFYPVLVDTPWMVLLVLSLIIMTRDALSVWSVVALSIISFCATLMRETGVLIPFTFLLSLYPVRRLFSVEVFVGRLPEPIMSERGVSTPRLLIYGLIPLSAALLGIVLSRQAVMAIGTYSFLSAALESARANNLWHLTISVFLAFGGPMLALLVIKPEVASDQLRATPQCLVLLALIVIVSYFGGVNTVRFLSWASPVVLLLVCRSLQVAVSELWENRSYVQGVIIALMLLGVVSYEVASLHPFEGYYRDYAAWAKWGGLQFSSLEPGILAGYLAVSIAAIFVWRWFGSTGTRRAKRRIVVTFGLFR